MMYNFAFYCAFVGIGPTARPSGAVPDECLCVSVCGRELPRRLKFICVWRLQCYASVSADYIQLSKHFIFKGIFNCRHGHGCVHPWSACDWREKKIDGIDVFTIELVRFWWMTRVSWQTCTMISLLNLLSIDVNRSRYVHENGNRVGRQWTRKVSENDPRNGRIFSSAACIFNVALLIALHSPCIMYRQICQ